MQLEYLISRLKINIPVYDDVTNVRLSEAHLNLVTNLNNGQVISSIIDLGRFNAQSFKYCMRGTLPPTNNLDVSTMDFKVPIPDIVLLSSNNQPLVDNSSKKCLPITLSVKDYSLKIDLTYLQTLSDSLTKMFGVQHCLLSELEEGVNLCISQGEANKWVKRSICEGSPNLIDIRQLKEPYFSVSKRLVTNQGISVRALNYNNQDIREFKGKRVIIKTDPLDITKIYAFVNNKLISIPAVDTEYTSKVKSWWRHGLIRRFTSLRGSALATLREYSLQAS